MSRPSYTRAQLRRAICAELQMPFFRYYGTYQVPDTSTSSEFLIDADLTQPDDFWKNQWLFVASDTSTGSSGNIGMVREIVRFDNANNKLFPDRPFVSPTSTGTQYEIHNVWNAFEIHNAINRAIFESFPDFFDIVTDETLVIKEDTTEYDISTVGSSIWQMSAVYVEQPTEYMTGVVTSAAATTLVDNNTDFSKVTPSWKVSIYNNKGAGQLRSINSVTGTHQLNVTAWTTIPDTTSMYKVWNPEAQRVGWYRLTALSFDKLEYPTKLYFPRPLNEVHGSRLRLVYATDPLVLNSEADTTIVPREFIVSKAIELLAASRVSSSRADREQYAIMEQVYRDKAERFRERNSFYLNGTLWQETDASAPSPYPISDPFGWYSR